MSKQCQLETVLNSMFDKQNSRLVKLIEEYRIHLFWPDYLVYLKDRFSVDLCLRWYSDTVTAYFDCICRVHIKGLS